MPCRHCGKPPQVVTSDPWLAAVAALRAAGCTCPLTYGYGSQREPVAKPVLASRTQLSRCPYHGSAAAAVAATPPTKD